MADLLGMFRKRRERQEGALAAARGARPVVKKKTIVKEKPGGDSSDPYSVDNFMKSIGRGGGGGRGLRGPAHVKARKKKMSGAY